MRESLEDKYIRTVQRCSRYWNENQSLKAQIKKLLKYKSENEDLRSKLNTVKRILKNNPYQDFQAVALEEDILLAIAELDIDIPIELLDKPLVPDMSHLVKRYVPDKSQFKDGECCNPNLFWERTPWYPDREYED